MSLPVHRLTATDCNAAAHANFKVKYSGILETKTAREKRGWEEWNIGEISGHFEPIKLKAIKYKI